MSYLPKMRTQLIAASSVAQALADLATNLSGPGAASASGGIVSEIAGPRPENLVDAAGLLVARRGDGLRIEEVSDPADPDGELYATGALLPGPNARLAGPTFAEG